MTDSLERYEYLNARGLQALKERSREAADERRLDWRWDETPYNRIGLVNLLARRFDDPRYLEIGCDQNLLFGAVVSSAKVGVDPERGGTHRMTSDDFFAQSDERFDLVFVDGLHDYGQVHRDVVNALGRLAPGGWVGIHDLLPSSWEEAHVPRLQSAWTGDVWKLGFQLARATGVEFRVVTIDHGVGLLRLTGGPVEIPPVDEALAARDFGWFVDHHQDLPLIGWDEAVAFVAAAPRAEPAGRLRRLFARG